MQNGASQSEVKSTARVRLQKFHAFRDAEPERTCFGGLSLVVQLMHRLGWQEAIDRRVHVLKVRQGYRESDHLLHLVNSIFAGGTCVEDVERLRQDEVYGRMLNVTQVTDPTTMGDFMRRFGRSEVNDLKEAIWDLRTEAWGRAGHRLPRHVTADLDSKVQEVYGNCKQGADYSWKKTFSYHPEMLSLAETGEWLDAVNRSGNEPSGEKAAYLLRRNLPRLRSQFHTVCVRGDVKFGRTDVLDVCRDHDTQVCVGWAAHPNLVEMAAALPKRAWQVLDRTAGQPAPAAPKRRRHRRNLRRQKARRRGYTDKRLQQEQVAEFAYRPTADGRRLDRTYRMVVIRKQIEVAGKTGLFDVFEYRFLLTDLEEPRLDRLVKYAYGRSNQENLIEQAQNGVSAFRMPTGELLANEVWMLAAMVAQCLKSWLCLLGLGRDKLTWEWKRFRFAFVYVVARVIRTARQLWMAFSTDARHFGQLDRALVALGSG